MANLCFGDPPPSREIRPLFLSPQFFRTTMFCVAVLFLVQLTAVIEAAQSALKASDKFENFLQIPKDSSDPAAWDFDWSFSGIRYFDTSFQHN